MNSATMVVKKLTTHVFWSLSHLRSKLGSLLMRNTRSQGSWCGGVCELMKAQSRVLGIERM